MEVSPITTDEEIAELSEMAAEIWREYWPNLIGTEQTEYMIEMFHSIPSLKRDLSQNGYLYWFLVDKGERVGYTGAHPEFDNSKLFISKIYLYDRCRGRGYASKVIKFYEDFCKETGLESMYLTVNKGNELAIRAYLGKGFETIDSVQNEIGNGFIMDDYVMEKSVS